MNEFAFPKKMPRQFAEGIGEDIHQHSEERLRRNAPEDEFTLQYYGPYWWTQREELLLIIGRSRRNTFITSTDSGV